MVWRFVVCSESMSHGFSANFLILSFFRVGSGWVFLSCQHPNILHVDYSKWMLHGLSQSQPRENNYISMECRLGKLVPPLDHQYYAIYFSAGGYCPDFFFVYCLVDHIGRLLVLKHPLRQGLSWEQMLIQARQKYGRSNHQTICFIHACDWNNWEHCGNGQHIHAGAKCGVCKFGIFIVVKYVFARRVNFKCFSVLLQDGKVCGNFCLDPLDVFACVVGGLFAGAIQHLAKPKFLTWTLNRCRIWRSCIARCSVERAEVWGWCGSHSGVVETCSSRILGSFVVGVQWHLSSRRCASIVPFPFLVFVP